MKDMVLIALVALIVGAAGGGWYGHRQAAKACEAERWRTEAETLRGTLVVRDAVAVVDRQIARSAAQSAAETEAEYAKLRRDYAAIKKSRGAKKTDPSEPAISASVRLPDPMPPDAQGARRHDPICPVADDLPLSDDLFGLYVNAFRPLLRASP